MPDIAEDYANDYIAKQDTVTVPCALTDSSLPMNPPGSFKAKTMQGYRNLRGWHHNVIHLHCAGMSAKEIAAQLKHTPVAVGRIINCPAGQAAIQRYHEAMGSNLQSYYLQVQSNAPEAIEKILEKMREGDTDTVQLKAATEILDRAGVSKVTHVPNTKAFMEDDSLAQFISHSEDIGIIDVEPIPPPEGEEASLDFSIPGSDDSSPSPLNPDLGHLSEDNDFNQ